jgi:hypothetical protein
MSPECPQTPAVGPLTIHKASEFRAASFTCLLWLSRSKGRGRRRHRTGGRGWPSSRARAGAIRHPPARRLRCAVPLADRGRLTERRHARRLAIVQAGHSGRQVRGQSPACAPPDARDVPDQHRRGARRQPPASPEIREGRGPDQRGPAAPDCRRPGRPDGVQRACG